jgi:Protein of unknown function (DUF1194)
VTKQGNPPPLLHRPFERRGGVRPPHLSTYVQRVALAAVAVALSTFAAPNAPVAAQETFAPVDTALIIAVDVSNSVDEHRYRLQMQGLAAALEDPGVVGTILNGAQGAILVSIVAWSDRTRVVLDWMRISSREEAVAVASRVRGLPRFSGEFTCLAEMLRFLHDKLLPTVPARANRKVVDVSGDGADNCNSRIVTPEIRDKIVHYGTVINGLPILEGSESATLEDWYEKNVKGGPGSFVLAAESFEDFGRAIRQKFIVEISGLDQDSVDRVAAADRFSLGRPGPGSSRFRN